MAAQLFEHTKDHWVAYFQKVNFMVCELYISQVFKNETVTDYDSQYHLP